MEAKRQSRRVVSVHERLVDDKPSTRVELGCGHSWETPIAEDAPQVNGVAVCAECTLQEATIGKPVWADAVENPPFDSSRRASIAPAAFRDTEGRQFIEVTP